MAQPVYGLVKEMSKVGDSHVSSGPYSWVLEDQAKMCGTFSGSC